MEVTNLLDIHTREDLYRWYQENHRTAPDFWLRINRAEADCHNGKMQPGWDDFGRLKDE